MSKIINENLIKNLLKEHYPKIISQADHIEIGEFNQGYMNFVFRLTVSNNHTSNHSKSDFVVIFYNSNRYTGKQANSFLEQAYLAAQCLGNNGINVRTPVSNQKDEYISEFKFRGKNRLVGIYNFLEGNTIPWEAYTRRHLHALGREMGKIHKIWGNYNGNISQIQVWRDYLEVDSKKMLGYFRKNIKSFNEKLKISLKFNEIQRIVEKLTEESQKLDKQLIHGDFVRSNILFSDKKEGEYYPITGVLDFEKVIKAPIEVDLARTLAFLIVDCKYKEAEEVVERFLQEGYLLECPNLVNFDSDINGRLKLYMIYFWMRDFWKLLQCNPYESLFQNEHYNRTKIVLLNSILKLIK